MNRNQIPAVTEAVWPLLSSSCGLERTSQPAEEGKLGGERFGGSGG